LLRTFPRAWLQRVAGGGLKFISIFYLGHKYTCPIINKSYRKFLPYGRIDPRDNALCPGSLSLERHRLLWLYLERKTNFFNDKLKVLHLAPEQCFLKKFDSMENLDYISADLESPLAKVKLDIHDIPFEENTFDVIICNHVLEHVDNDLKALSEMYRVMKPTGWGIFQVPFFKPVPDHTIEDITIKDPKERERLFGQDDHVRKYGNDFADRLSKPGFYVTADNFVKTLAEDEVIRYALPADEIIFVCRKAKVNQSKPVLSASG